MTNNVYVRLIDLPCRVRGFVLANGEDDSYNIYLNARLSRTEQKKAYLHEMRHILQKDFDRGGNVSRIEERMQ